MNIVKDDGQGTDSAEALNEGDKGIKRSISNNDGPMEIMETMIKKAKNIENSNNGNSDANFITNSNADEPYDGDLEEINNECEDGILNDEPILACEKVVEPIFGKNGAGKRQKSIKDYMPNLGPIKVKAKTDSEIIVELTAQLESWKRKSDINEKIVREMRLNWRYLQSKLKNAHVEIGELREQNRGLNNAYLEVRKKNHPRGLIEDFRRKNNRYLVKFKGNFTSYAEIYKYIFLEQLEKEAKGTKIKEPSLKTALYNAFPHLLEITDTKKQGDEVGELIKKAYEDLSKQHHEPPSGKQIILDEENAEENTIKVVRAVCYAYPCKYSAATGSL